MTLSDELAAMQALYQMHPMQTISLNRPAWLTDSDPMSAIYQEKSVLLQQGTICYGHIVQANTILFRMFPPFDCPAQIVFSTDPTVANDPSILRDLAVNLFRYKNKPLRSVPKQWREIARVLTDELDRSAFTFSIEYNSTPVTFHLLPVMIFRKLLPERRLCGSFLPILTAPDCQSVLVLPKRYWSKEFTQLWVDGMI